MPFWISLSKSDLLISFSSTTIEEALNLRKPVGLFGGTSRYQHTFGSKNPPTESKRSAVYILNEKNLSFMIDSIINAHKTSPLTDEELKGYVWRKDVPSYDNFIDEIIA